MSKKSPSRNKKESDRKARNSKHEAMVERDFEPTGKSKYAKKAKRAAKGKFSPTSPFKSQ